MNIIESREHQHALPQIFPSSMDVSRWFVSLHGSFKMNYDAVFLNGEVKIRVIVCDSKGDFCLLWRTTFLSQVSFPC